MGVPILLLLGLDGCAHPPFGKIPTFLNMTLLMPWTTVSKVCCHTKIRMMTTHANPSFVATPNLLLV